MSFGGPPAYPGFSGQPSNPQAYPGYPPVAAAPGSTVNTAGQPNSAQHPQTGPFAAPTAADNPGASPSPSPSEDELPWDPNVFMAAPGYPLAPGVVAPPESYAEANLYAIQAGPLGLLPPGSGGGGGNSSSEAGFASNSPSPDPGGSQGTWPPPAGPGGVSSGFTGVKAEPAGDGLDNPPPPSPGGGSQASLLPLELIHAVDPGELHTTDLYAALCTPGLSFAQPEAVKWLRRSRGRPLPPV